MISPQRAHASHPSAPAHSSPLSLPHGASAALGIVVLTILLNIANPCHAQKSPGAQIRVSFFQRTNCNNGSCEVKPVANLCSATCVGLVRDRLLFVTAGHALWNTGKDPDIELDLNGTWTPARLELLGNQANGPDLAAVSVSGDVRWPMARLHTNRPAAGELVRINSILFGDTCGRIEEGTLDGFTWATFDRQIRPGDSGSGVYDSQGLCGMLAWRDDVDPKKAWLVPPGERQRRWYHGRYIDGAVIAHWLHTHNLTPQLPTPRPFVHQDDEFTPRLPTRPPPSISPPTTLPAAPTPIPEDLFQLPIEEGEKKPIPSPSLPQPQVTVPAIAENPPQQPTEPSCAAPQPPITEKENRPSPRRTNSWRDLFRTIASATLSAAGFGSITAFGGGVVTLLGWSLIRRLFRRRSRFHRETPAGQMSSSTVDRETITSDRETINAREDRPPCRAPFPRKLDEARQLLEIRQSEGRVAVLDALRGMFLDDEITKRLDAAETTEEEKTILGRLIRHIDQRVDDVAPLSATP